MKHLLTLLIAVFISFAAVAQSEKSIVIEQSSFRAVQSDALTGVNIDPIGEDSSRRPCARIKVRINRMTKEDINAIEVRIATNNELRKCKTAEYDNGLIIEMTAKPNSRFYFYHPRLGYSNEVNVNLEANKEYRIDAYLNQLLSITVMSDAVGADVYIDDMYRGQIGANSTLVVHGISANKHFLVLQYADKKIEQDINVNSENFVFVSNLKSSQQQPIQLPDGGRMYATQPNKHTPNTTSDIIGDFDMVFVEGGTFTMGATSEQGTDALYGEKPAHYVTVSDFYIGKYEVTQAQWRAVMGSNPSKFKGDNLPVEQVSWNDIQKFITKLNTMTGKTFRLPTEAEWEYAARGGNKSKGYKYSGSNTLDNVAWYTNNSSSKTHPVGQKQPNELGLYDMSGNVWEWCQDWYGSYSSSSQTNPTGPSSGSYRVLRGGSWDSIAWCCRVSYRYGFNPDYRDDDGGFRLACSSK